MNEETKFDKLVNLMYDWIILPLIVMMFFAYLKLTYSENQIINTIYFTMCGLGSCIFIFTFIMKALRLFYSPQKIIFPLVLGIGCIVCSIIMIFSHNDAPFFITLGVGIFFIELYLMYDIIDTIFSNYNKKPLKIMILSVLFIVIGFGSIYIYSFHDSNLFSSLITIFSSIIGGGITLAGVAWTILATEQSRKIDKEFELVQNCSIITFDKIESFQYFDNQIVIFDNSNNLILNNDNESINQLENYSNYFQLRFVFNNNGPLNNIKNISFSKISIYPKFVLNKESNEDYIYIEKISNKFTTNISLPKPGIIQVNCNLLFNKKENIEENNSKMQNNFIDKLLQTTGDEKIFFNIKYSVTNLNNVSYCAELKFYCKIKNIDNKYVVVDFENISNWIETPKLLKEDINKE